MNETYLKIVLETLAEKIDKLSRDVYFRNLEADNLREDNAKLAKLKMENEALKMENETLKEALALTKVILEEAEDGKL